MSRVNLFYLDFFSTFIIFQLIAKFNFSQIPLGLPPTPPETDVQLNSDAPEPLEQLVLGQLSSGLGDQFSTPIRTSYGAFDVPIASPLESGQCPLTEVTPWTPPIPSHLLGRTAPEEVSFNNSLV